jgi:predicted AlkP superfamily pyrophosphatase or phosphodiesterase
MGAKMEKAKEYSMTNIAPTVSALLDIRPPAQSAGPVVSEIIDDMGHHDRIAVVVLDAFGIATWKRYEELAPNFNLIASQHLLHVRSVLPPKTPVNFATMVTGAPSDVHMIRDRTEPLTVETIFHVLSEASMKSAAVGRASSTVGILLSKFADYKGIAASNTDEELLQLGINIIREKSPEFILMQLLDIDDTGHKYGLAGDEIRRAASDIDRHLGELLPYLAEGGYGLIVLADHGAHQVGEKATHDGSSEDDLVVPLTWRSSEYLREIYDLD